MGGYPTGSGGGGLPETPLAIAHGGTAASTAANARTALGLGTAATSAATAFDASGAAAAAQAASQPLDADLTALAAANNSASLVKVGAANATIATTGAVTWNPNLNPTAFLAITGNISSITLTAPTTTDQTVVLFYQGDGVHTWPAVISGALLVGGSLTAPVGSQINALQLRAFIGGVTAWIQASPIAINPS